MDTVTIHVRLRKSEFDNESDHTSEIDDDVRHNTRCAYRSALRFIREIKDSHEVDWRIARSKIRPAITRITAKFWSDLDHDDRYRAVHLKREAQSLLPALQKAADDMEQLSGFFIRAMQKRIVQRLAPKYDDRSDLFDMLAELNSALLVECRAQSAVQLKKEGAHSYANACKDLVILWKDVTGIRFSTQLTKHLISGKLNKRNWTAEFDTVEARFVHSVIYEMSNRWVRPSEVATALTYAFKR